ncbi:MAG: FAD-dependent monooxygenase [Zoogloeaceae bacterium]|nr:FAD-dependent monooxygenase [Zoogloeaceae bacterium]
MTDPDILIIGGGPAGLALALALADSGKPVAVADARDAGTVAADPRALALAHGSRLILEGLGVWQGLAATPIETIHVSQRGGFGRTVLRAGELGVPALGHVVSAGVLAGALRRAVEAAGIEVRDGAHVTTLTPEQDRIVATLNGSETITARLAVRAEGAPGDGDAVKTRDYGQHALIASVHPRDGHHHLAFERFTPEGPLALLPFGDDYASVLVVSGDTADRLAALDDATYLAHLQQTIGGRTSLSTVGPRVRYPLALRVRESSAGARTAWLGNAAQTLHPVAGQGFNLALRDVHTLADAVREAADPGDVALLAAWARGRRLDRAGTIGFTDGLIRVFANDFAPLSVARGLGLAAMDLCAPLRGFVARRMMFGARAWP